MYHFNSEEHLLAEYGYPDLDKHKKEHERFSSTLNNLKGKLPGDKIALAEEIRDFLEEWIIRHILDTNKKYSSFLSEKMSREEINSEQT